MPRQFDHEKLKVYQEAIRFVTWSYDMLSRNGCPGAVKNQLERSSISIPLNIAEGNAKSGIRDRQRYFEIAMGSAFESAAAIDILVATKVISGEIGAAGNSQLHELVSMLVGLIKSVGSNRLAEEASEDLYEVS